MAEPTLAPNSVHDYLKDALAVTAESRQEYANHVDQMHEIAVRRKFLAAVRALSQKEKLERLATLNTAQIIDILFTKDDKHTEDKQNNHINIHVKVAMEVFIDYHDEDLDTQIQEAWTRRNAMLHTTVTLTHEDRLEIEHQVDAYQYTEYAKENVGTVGQTDKTQIRVRILFKDKSKVKTWRWLIVINYYKVHHQATKLIIRFEALLKDHSNVLSTIFSNQEQHAINALKTAAKSTLHIHSFGLLYVIGGVKTVLMNALPGDAFVKKVGRYLDHIEHQTDPYRKAFEQLHYCEKQVNHVMKTQETVLHEQFPHGGKGEHIIYKMIVFDNALLHQIERNWHHLDQYNKGARTKFESLKKQFMGLFSKDKKAKADAAKLKKDEKMNFASLAGGAILSIVHAAEEQAGKIAAKAAGAAMGRVNALKTIEREIQQVKNKLQQDLTKERVREDLPDADGINKLKEQYALLYDTLKHFLEEKKATLKQEKLLRLNRTLHDVSSKKNGIHKYTESLQGDREKWAKIKASHAWIANARKNDKERQIFEANPGEYIGVVLYPPEPLLIRT